MAFKVLLTEHSSPLGSALLRGFETHSLSIVTAEKFDPQRLCRLVELHKPSIIINCQSISEATGEDLVAQGHALVELSRLHDCVLLHFSSHRVFGRAQYGAALSEVDVPAPDDDLGRALLAQEQVLESWERSLIVRLPWLLDTPCGVLDSMCRALVYTGECVVSDAWRGSPVFMDDVVRVSVAMVHQILCGAANWGCFHLHSSDSCSEAELADHIARLIQKQGYEVGSIALGSLEQRFVEANGWLKGQRCTNNFGFQYRSWRQGVKGRVVEWLEAEVKAGRLAPAVTA